jgi:hypothetical protein
VGQTCLIASRTRTGSPSAHPRPASGGATDFFLASALSFHQRVLRPSGGEDARCVRSISATQTNRVYPHLARSRLALTAFTVGTPYGVLGSVGLTGGPSVSRHPRPLRRIVVDHGSRALGLTASGRERGRFLPTVVDAIEPLTPLSRSPRSPSRLRRLRACCHLAARPVPSFGGGGLARVGGWGGRRDHRPRRLVKADAS